MRLGHVIFGMLLAGLLLGCGPAAKPMAKQNSSSKKTANAKSAKTTSPKAPKPKPIENDVPAVDFTPPGLRPGSQPAVETPPVKSPTSAPDESAPKPPASSQAAAKTPTGKTPAGKTRKSVSGVFEYWMPNGASASDPFDFRSGDIQSKGLQWFSRNMETMLGFAEVRLDGPATKEILKQTAEQSSMGEDPNIPWKEITFCGCRALERIEVLDFGEGKSLSREIIFIDGDTIYQVEGLEPGDKPVNAAVKKLFDSCKRVGGAKTSAAKGRGDYVRSPISGEYEVWMPREPLKMDPGQIKYKDRLGECWSGFTVDTDLTFYLAELDVGEPATLAITHDVVNEYWRPAIRGTSTREVKYAGRDAVEQTVISVDELQVRYFIPIGNKVYFVGVMGTDKQGDLPDFKKFLSSFRKHGDATAADAMKDIPGGPVTKRAMDD